MPKNSSTLVLWILPFLLLAPEVLQVGDTFVRWDYFALPVGLGLIFYRVAFGSGLSGNMGYDRSMLWLIGAICIFGVYQLSCVNRNDADAADAFKYALWPFKVVIWAMLVRELFLKATDTTERVYIFFMVLTYSLLLIQGLELISPAFKEILNTLFPTAAKERLSTIGFRARAVFNGYDTASMFFCLSAVVMDSIAKTKRWRKGVGHLIRMAACLIGAMLAARTGFLLLVVYIFMEGWRSLRPAFKVAVLFLVVTIIAYLSAFPPTLTGEEGSLSGRYLELFEFVKTGDPTSVDSFFGTLYMNYSLFWLNDWNVLWGNGLSTLTTADQLYAKYLFMLGSIGMAFWAAIHVGLMSAMKLRRLREEPLAKASFVYLFMMAIAHIKGGNYLFAQRLGELTVLVLLLAASPINQTSHDK